MRNQVLDSSALITFLFAEEGYETVTTLLEKVAESGRSALVPSPAWAEIRYEIGRHVPDSEWASIRSRILGLPIEVVPVDQELAELAGEIKARSQLAISGCFVAALAKSRKAELVTGNPGFHEIEREVRIVWISDRSQRARDRRAV